MATRNNAAGLPEQARHPRTLGLSKWRQSKGISLEDIAARTKIGLHFLRAIEEEEFSKLPGGIFNTSYLRQYASATAFDESKLLAHYERQTSESSVACGKAQPVSPHRNFFVRWLRTSPQAQH